MQWFRIDFIDKQIAPPKSWEKFEDLTRALFAAVWKAPLTQKNGRSGQKQHGVDVYGTQAPVSAFTAQAVNQTLQLCNVPGHSDRSLPVLPGILAELNGAKIRDL